MMQRSLSSVRTWALPLCLLTSLFFAMPTMAQVDDEVISGVQFNFTPPGARSLGLGGAFLAVANDATTAYTNPAGITNLTRREVTVEGRTFESSSLFTDFGRDGTTPTGFGVDTNSQLILGETNDDSSGLSFLSYVQPIGDFRIAFFRHEVVNFETGFQTRGAFYNVDVNGNGVDDDCVVGGQLGGCSRLFPVETNLELDIENFAVSFAYEFTEGFSIGVGVNFYQFEIDALTNRQDLLFVPDFTGEGQFFGPPSFAPSSVFASQRQIGDDDDIGINVGLLWDVNQRFSVGAVYRQGAEFDYDYILTCGPSDPAFCQTVPGLETGTSLNPATFNLPEVLGLGIAIKPTDTFTITLDWNQIEYTALLDDFTIAAGPSARLADFSVDDADELHLGFEYVFASLANPIYIRWGAWEDPAHQIAYNGPEPAESLLLWAGGNIADDELHLSVGVGFTIGENMSIDVAYDDSDRLSIGALSAVFRF